MSAPAVPGKTSAVALVEPVAQAGLTHLFRHSLREGRVHPLLHVVQRYRQESPR